jgi:isopenicillin N synthase-like dioxygenase
MLQIPEIDVSPLFSASSRKRDIADRLIFHAATETGFMIIHGIPNFSAINKQAKESLIHIFSLPADKQRTLWKQNFAAENQHLYRGWFPLHSGATLSREGFEMGPDIVREIPDCSDDLLYEKSVLPDESDIPGFHATAAKYFLTMETIGEVLLDSISRGLGIDEFIFRDAFRDGISTLRLLRYIPRDNLPLTDKLKRSRGAHIDSGLLTILATCRGVPGLQARDSLGHWQDIPARNDTLIINFGGLLSRWTGGRVKASEHGVNPIGQERFSIPFFFEPRPDTRIEPLPLPGMTAFKPFLFGDYLWATTTKFPENFALLARRPHKAPYEDPLPPPTAPGETV